eukprot:TRINITY_DN39189_c0_g1_i4.p1 TRINITY_DN39189_c0_g1~~TRINITY_DN39189_c0_g1_i4.p1  ORF type:complete len:999 (+),score=168.31 TRINITY_DN39189_c0_g1_i4:96-3092(+)
MVILVPQPISPQYEEVAVDSEEADETPESTLYRSMRDGSGTGTAAPRNNSTLGFSSLAGLERIERILNEEARKEAVEQENASSMDQHAQLAAGATFGRWRKSVSYWRHWRQEHESDSDSRSSQNSESSMSSSSDPEDLSMTWTASLEHPCCGYCSGGLRTWQPELYNWIVARLGTRTRVMLIMLFVLVDGGRFCANEVMMTHIARINVLSLLVVQNAVSLCIGLVVAYGLEGSHATSKIFDWHPVWRFLGIAFVFTGSTLMINLSYVYGASAGAVATLGNIYLPLAAVLSFFVMKRLYGKLEWLSLCILTLSMMTFVLLRERAKANSLLEGAFNRHAFGFIFAASAMSAFGSIFAERIYKDRSFGLWRAHRGLRHDRFWIHKIHLDFGSLLATVALWCVPSEWYGQIFKGLENNQNVWFGDWDWHQGLLISVLVVHSWLAGIITKRFSTVLKSIVQTVSFLLVVLILDPILSGYHFMGGALPESMLAIIIALSAMIFQTGRIEVNKQSRLLRVSPAPAINASDLGWWASVQAILAPPKWDGMGDKKPAVGNDAAGASEENASEGQRRRQRCMAVLRKNASVITFVVFDSSRTLSQQAVLSKSMITPQSMVLATFLCGVFIATALTAAIDGRAGLKLAFAPEQIWAALPCAFFFALSGTLMSLAYAAGISPALAIVLGYIYMPVSALASRYILGKYYMWLEWFALMILTLAASVFGYLQTILAVLYANLEGEGLGGSRQQSAASLIAMGMIIGSAVSSVFGSLVSERILKAERLLPFHIQKVRLDVGSVLATLLLFPIIGLISTRPQDAFWKQRPEGLCSANECWPSKNATGATEWGCAATTCTSQCSCGSGVWVSWFDELSVGDGCEWLPPSQAWVVVALLINVAQGWLGGKITKTLGTVERAIAQMSTLLVVYFLGDPLINPATSHMDLSLTLMAFIVPLSTTVNMVAVSEVERLTRLAAPGGDDNNERHEDSTVGGSQGRELTEAASGDSDDESSD